MTRRRFWSFRTEEALLQNEHVSRMQSNELTSGAPQTHQLLLICFRFPVGPSRSGLSPPPAPTCAAALRRFHLPALKSNGVSVACGGGVSYRAVCSERAALNTEGRFYEGVCHALWQLCLCTPPPTPPLLEQLLASAPLTCVPSPPAWLNIPTDSVMMLDRWIPLSPSTATMWKNTNLTPFFIQM